MDSIDNHTPDLGRWFWKSQALVFVPEEVQQPTANSSSLPNSVLQWQQQLVDVLARNKRYPAEAMSRGEEGLAVVHFTVDRSGHLISSRIEQSSGSALLDHEVIDLLNRAQPFPSLPSDYTAAQISLNVPIRFNIPGRTPQQPTTASAAPPPSPQANGEESNVHESQSTSPSLPLDKTSEAIVTDCDKYAASDIDPQRKTTGVPFDKINPALAVPACEDAVQQYSNSDRLIYQLGRAYQKANNFTAGVVQYRKAAEQSYAPAQNALGVIYQNGQGVPKDDQQAIAWYRKAADQGLAAGEVNLGDMYLNGRGVAQDDAQALAWFRKAADQGFKDAKTKLDELEMLQNAQRDPDDVVAQVLNYTVFGKDEGSGDSYWFKDPKGTCLYRLHIAFQKSQNGDFATNFLLNFGIGNALLQRRVIDLDTLDPKNLTFRYDNNQHLWGENGVGTVIQHINDVLFFYVGTLDLNRLQRGWSLIYSKYCRGKEKPF